MKILVFIVACLCEALAITVHYDIKGKVSNNNVREHNDTLRDLRLVPINQVQVHQRSSRPISQPQAELKTLGKSKNTSNNKNFQTKFRKDRKKITSKLDRVGQSDSHSQADESHQNYMQKMADQLYIAQKHASLLSDYQKFIINQDPHVKSFVLGQTVQSRNPKPFSRSKQSGRSLSVSPIKINHGSTEIAQQPKEGLQRIVVVTPKVPNSSEKIPFVKNDYSAQSTDTKFVTLAPQPITHLVQAPEPTKKIALVPYYTSQPQSFYDLAVTNTPQTQEVQIPTTLSLGSYEFPRHHHQEIRHLEKHAYADPKYEFMYKVKDQEKSNHFGHMESRTDKGTYGYYFVQLPDGRLETVKYWADKTGYHAKVDYQGEAKHPPDSPKKLHSQHNLVHYL